MISLAKQQGSMVDVYNENGGLMWSRSGTLQGFTSTTVAIQQGSIISVYDQNGSIKFTR